MNRELNLPPSNNTPPKLGQKCLNWSLPEPLKEPVLGDLEEAFHDKSQSHGHGHANSWYLRQALLTTLTYLKQTQRGMLMFAISIVVFIAMFAMAVLLSGDIGMFVNVPSLLIVLPPSVFFALAATSKKSFSDGFRLLLDDQVQLTRKELLSSKRAFSTLGNTAMWTGFLGVVIGAIAIASNVEPEMFSKVIGPASAVGLLTVLYGTAIKIPCFLAEQKIQFRIDNQD